MFFDVAAYSAVGKRKNNEDSFVVLREKAGLFAVVADGVGGCDGGEVASRAAVDSLAASVSSEPFSMETLEDALVEANRAVLNAGSGTAKTTVAVLWCFGAEARAVNVGDSRIYQFRDGKIVFQSTDHSIPQLDVASGLITPGEIRNHKDRNRITRCLGLAGPVKMNRKALDVLPGDRFLLCSDGFWEPVWEEDMLGAAEESSSAKDWLNRMKAIAFENERDNHTAIAIVVTETEEST